MAEARCGNAKVFQIRQFLGQSAKVTDSVGNAVEKGPDMNFVNDCVFVPILHAVV